MVLAVDEHTANVMEHSDISPKDSVVVSLDIRDSTLLAEVEDPGPEFNPASGVNLVCHT